MTEKAQVRIRTQPLDRAMAVVRGHWRCETQADDALLVDVQQDDTPRIVKRLIENDVQVYEVAPHRQTLVEWGDSGRA